MSGLHPWSKRIERYLYFSKTSQFPGLRATMIYGLWQCFSKRETKTAGNRNSGVLIKNANPNSPPMLLSRISWHCIWQLLVCGFCLHSYYKDILITKTISLTFQICNTHIIYWKRTILAYNKFLFPFVYSLKI